MKTLWTGIVLTVVGFAVAPLTVMALTQPGTPARSVGLIVGGWVFVAGLVVTVVAAIRLLLRRRNAPSPQEVARP